MTDKILRRFGTIDTPAEQEKLTSVDSADVELGLIFSKGFPLGTDEATAIAQAETDAQAMYPGIIFSEEVVHSDDLTANNEFLVTVRILKSGVIGG